MTAKNFLFPVKYSKFKSQNQKIQKILFKSSIKFGKLYTNGKTNLLTIRNMSPILHKYQKFR